MGQDPGREDGDAAAALALPLGKEHVGGRQVRGGPEVTTVKPLSGKKKYASGVLTTPLWQVGDDHDEPDALCPEAAVLRGARRPGPRGV